MRPKIDLANFDHHGNLKPPPWLLLSAAYLSRYLLIFLASGLSAFVATGRGAGLGVRELPPVGALFSSVPAALIFTLILVRERLSAGSLARFVSRYGRPILLLTGVGQSVLLLYLLMSDGAHGSLFRVVDLVLLGYVALYVWKSRSSQVYFREYCSGL